MPARWIALLLGCWVCAAGACSSSSSPLSSEAQIQQALYHSSCSDLWLASSAIINITSTLIINRTVHLQSSTLQHAVLSGLNLSSSSSSSSELGGGRLVYIAGGNVSVTVTRVRFTQARGGAVQMDTVAGKVLLFEHCAFSANGSPSLVAGAGLYAAYSSQDQGSLVVRNSSFTRNTAFRGGAVAVYLDGDAVQFNEVLFQGNLAAIEGGGVWAWTGSSHDLAGQGASLGFSRCTFSNNTARDDTGTVGSVGGALHLRLTSVRVNISNSVFSYNTASKVGGGMYTFSSIQTTLTLTDSLFLGNSIAAPLVGRPKLAFDGGAWFSQGTALCQQSCVDEVMIVHRTRFIQNSASEGAAVYVLSGAAHSFSECVWERNAGLPLDLYDGFPAGVVSRGAVLYSGLLSLNVSIQDSSMIDNLASDSSTLALRPSIFKGALALIRVNISDTVSLPLGLNTLKFKYVPQVNVSFANCSVLGAVMVSTGVVIDTSRTIFPTGLTVTAGGVALLHKSRVSDERLQFAAPCNASSRAEMTSSSNSLGVCKETDQRAGGTETGRILQVSDADANPVDLSATPYVVSTFELKILEASAIEGPEGPKILQSSEYQDSARLSWLTVSEGTIAECTTSSVTLVCQDSHDGNGLALWSLILIGVLSSILVCATLLRGVVLYKRWAVPGIGIHGCPSCGCVCYRFLACGMCAGHRKDVFESSVETRQQIEQLEISIIRSHHQGPEADTHLRAIHAKASLGAGEDSIQARVANFGYGLIDYSHDLCLKDTIGKGNFGTVRIAVLRSRGHHPARLVAVKELIAEASSMELLCEAKLMQDLPPHPNVVFLFGVTENPFCMVSQLVEDAHELQDHITHLSKHQQPQARLQHTLRLLLDACTGLAHLHEHRVLHCDIAPRNVLVANSFSAEHDMRIPHALINDFGLSRKLGESEAFVSFSGGYDRYLAPPENYNMQSEHGMEGDVFMMCCTVWESVSLNWGQFKQFFAEGKGLKSLDLRQVTKPANHRLHTEEKRGIRMVYEAATHFLCTHTLRDQMSHQICALMCRGLQHDPEERPSMEQLRGMLWEAWRTCVEMEEGLEQPEPQGKRESRDWLLPKMGEDPVDTDNGASVEVVAL